jgi:hypothetical protein
MQRADQRKYHIIYKTTCAITGKWYLGMHSTDDLNDGYIGSGQLLWKSIKKYGKENHTYQVLEMLPSRKELSLREAELITEEVRADEQCLNLRNGGTGNDPGFWQMTDEEKRKAASEKLSAKSKAMWARRKADPDALTVHIEKLNKPEHVITRAEAIKAKGHKRTPEQLARLSAGQSKYYSTVDESVLKARGQKAAEQRAKVWVIEDQAGNKQEVKDLVKFSEAHGIKRTALYKTEHAGTYRAGYRIVGRI